MLKRLLFKENKATIFLAIFRVFIGVHILKKIVFQWGSLSLLYGPERYIVTGEDTLFHLIGISSTWWSEHYAYFICSFMIFAVLFIFGIGKHFTAAILFLHLLLFQRLNGLILNGGDNLLILVFFYLVFCDSYQYLSLKKLTFKNKVWADLSKMITNLGILSVKVHLCLVYLVSGMHKMHADYWFKGIAVYYTLSLERFMGTSWNKHLVQNGVFVTLSTYAVLFWELFFPVLIWVKKCRIPLLLMGIGMHAGIYIFMMIHDFEILFIMIYGFFFTDEEYKMGYRKLASWWSGHYLLKHLKISTILD